MQETVTLHIFRLRDFALQKGLIDPEDAPYLVNQLLDLMGMDAPEDISYAPENAPETATTYLTALADDAVALGRIADSAERRDLFTARAMGLLTPSPTEIRRAFQEKYDISPETATEWFYTLSRDVDYIRVDRIARNTRFFAPSDAGELEITINLSKPEKDPRDIAAARNAAQADYPKCMLCKENPGYAGRIGFPARQNHRMIPLTLDGSRWYFQYSPYLYYNEHCIVLNEQHVPMRISHDTFVRLFDFVDQFPHYFLGSNADLPIVGGSILSHDHFQGGHYAFPMDKAPARIALNAPVSGVSAAVVDWPMSCVRLIGQDRGAIVRLADDMLTAWRAWSDPENGIYAETDQPHNTITPVAHREGDAYRLDLVLRNNRTDAENPLGIFHPHSDLHHIKKENIGLIEVMGLFILPGRLDSELKALIPYLTGAASLRETPTEDSPIAKHFSWVQEIAAAVGTGLTEAEAQSAIRAALAKKCARVLSDAGVYKNTETGNRGILKFLQSLGYAAK